MIRPPALHTASVSVMQEFLLFLIQQLLFLTSEEWLPRALAMIALSLGHGGNFFACVAATVMHSVVGKYERATFGFVSKPRVFQPQCKLLTSRLLEKAVKYSDELDQNFKPPTPLLP